MLTTDSVTIIAPLRVVIRSMLRDLIPTPFGAPV